MAGMTRWTPLGGLSRWDPLRDLLVMERDLNRMFADLGALPPMTSMEQRGDFLLTPSIDVMNRGEDLVVRAEMPGIRPEDVDISVVGDMMTIRGKHAEQHETKEEDYLFRESTRGEFVRTLRLPEGVKPEDIHAESRDGVIEVVVPHGAQRAVRDPVHVPIEHKPSEPMKIEAHKEE